MKFKLHESLTSENLAEIENEFGITSNKTLQCIF